MAIKVQLLTSIIRFVCMPFHPPNEQNSISSGEHGTVIQTCFRVTYYLRFAQINLVMPLINLFMIGFNLPEEIILECFS